MVIYQVVQYHFGVARLIQSYTAEDHATDHLYDLCTLPTWEKTKPTYRVEPLTVKERYTK